MAGRKLNRQWGKKQELGEPRVAGHPVAEEQMTVLTSLLGKTSIDLLSKGDLKSSLN